MTRSPIRYGSVLFLVLLAGSAATAQPLTIATPPRAKSAPAPQLADPAPKAPSLKLPLLACLNGLLRGDTSQGIKFCSMALDLNPKEHDAYKLRGYAYLTEHRFELAGTDFRAALKLRPRDHEDLAGFAQSLSGQGLFSQAVAQYRLAVGLAPNKAPYWNGLCWARAGTGRQLKQALSECNHALALQPGAAATLNSRGLIHLRMKQFSRALAEYDAALAAGPRQASARFGRGLAQLQLGRERQGAADIIEARRLDPGIDGLFRLMGVLPPGCAPGPGHTSCPSGFPLPKPVPASPNSMIAAATGNRAP